jgi:pimeloyl-ACP methyl ester carboxylesterase
MPSSRIRARNLIAAAAVAAAVALAPPAASSQQFLHVKWMRSVAVAGTPTKYDRVGVIKIGPAAARNVLVLEPGTSAGAAYFVPLAQWLVSKLPGWQVWSVERRENLFEDQSVLTRGKRRVASERAVFNYYLGFLLDHSITRHLRIVPDTSAEFVKNWGVGVAVRDMNTVIQAARRLGGKVVLGGHSLGGALVTAYATWNFGGGAGARFLDGLVYDDGAGFGNPVSAGQARQNRANLFAPTTSPFLVFGFPAPYLGLYSATGALSALYYPNEPSLGQTFAGLPPVLKPSVRVTNLALFAWNTNVSTSALPKFVPMGGFAFLAHMGKGLSAHMFHGARGWNSAGALTPPQRWAQMLGGPQVANADGVEWYFPDRLFVDGLQSGAIDNGNANAAQQVLGIRDTMGHRLPKRLLMYAFGAYGGKAITAATVALARQSRIPMQNLTLVSRQRTYAHNDPAGAYPHNVFFDHLLRFLRKVLAQRS